MYFLRGNFMNRQLAGGWAHRRQAEKRSWRLDRRQFDDFLRKEEQPPPCILGCKGDQLWNPLMRSKGLSSAMLVPKIKEEIFCKLKAVVKEFWSLQKSRNCKVWERWKRLFLWGGCLLICRRRAAKSDQTESTSSYTATTPTLVSLYLFSETDKWRKISWH